MGDHPRSRGVYSVSIGWLMSHLPDHPRSRGVYIRRVDRDAEQLGSSPLARGLLPVGVPDADRLGIIPARAGFTVPVAYGQS